MKEQIIQLPDTFEIKEIKDGKIILVEKEKKLTYEDIIEQLFPLDKVHYYIADDGDILDSHNREITRNCKNNATSKKQLEKILAINMLMNVAKYLNDDWQPDWNNDTEHKYSIYYSHRYDQLSIDDVCVVQFQSIYFKSKELSQQAISILGEETIKLALCTDY